MVWDLVPWSGIEAKPSALGALSFSHWTTREVWGHFFGVKGVVLPSAGGFVRVHAPPPLGSGGDKPWRGGRLECDPRGCWAQVPVTVLCRLWGSRSCSYILFPGPWSGGGGGVGACDCFQPMSVSGSDDSRLHILLSAWDLPELSSLLTRHSTSWVLVWGQYGAESTADPPWMFSAKDSQPLCVKSLTLQGCLLLQHNLSCPNYYKLLCLTTWVRNCPRTILAWGLPWWSSD